jgi:hypothetical protein
MKLEFSGFFEKYLPQMFMKIRPLGTELFHPERGTEGQT